MKKRDIYLIASVLLLAAVFWMAPRAAGLFGKEDELSLQITVAGEVYGVYSLKENQTIHIGDTNICEIKDEKVTMSSADCPDHLCMRQGPADIQGETIVCLPNKVVLEIIGSDHGDKEPLDGIVN